MKEFKWKYCTTCQVDYIECPECGNNCCSGGHGEDSQGNECEVCKEAYEYQDKHRSGI